MAEKDNNNTESLREGECSLCIIPVCQKGRMCIGEEKQQQHQQQQQQQQRKQCQHQQQQLQQEQREQQQQQQHQVQEQQQQQQQQRCRDENGCASGSSPLDRDFIFRVPGQMWYRETMWSAFNTRELLEHGFSNFRAKDDDIIIAGYPKSGTTWLEEVVYLVMNDGDLDLANSAPVYQRVPYLDDTRSFAYIADGLTSPRIYKTHVRPDLLPRHIFTTRAKIIYILRNPKDTAVSYYHFYRALSELGNFAGPWSEFWEMFLKGYVVCGSWFQHVGEWWKLKADAQVFMLSYEHMMRDPRKMIIDISEFCGKTLDEKTIQLIMDHTSFQSMKENPMTNFTNASNIDSGISPFMRKGIVGDWISYFTRSQLSDLERTIKSQFDDIVCRELSLMFGEPSNP